VGKKIKESHLEHPIEFNNKTRQLRFPNTYLHLANSLYPVKFNKEHILTSSIFTITLAFKLYFEIITITSKIKIPWGQ